MNDYLRIRIDALEKEVERLNNSVDFLKSQVHEYEKILNVS